MLALVLSAANTYLTGWVGERVLADLRNKLFAHLERLSLGFYERNRAGVVISRITNDVEALDQLVTDGVTSLIQNTLLLVGTAVVLFLLDWQLALATLTVLIPMALVTAWFRSRSNRAYRRVRERLGLVTATLAEDIAGMRVVQSFTREPVQQKAFHGVNDRYRAANYETTVLNAIYFPAVDLLATAATAIVFGYGGWLVYHGEMTAGTLFAFALYLSNFFDPIQQLSQLYNTFLSAIAALDKIIGVLDEEPQVVDPAGAGSLPRIEGRVHFENVRFGYGPEFPEVLHGLELDVPGRDDRRARRAHRRRQVDDREADRPLLRPDRGADHDRRHRPARGDAALAPPPARDRPAGGLPLRRHRRREHRLRAPGRAAGGDRGGRGGGRRRPLHPRARGRLRDAARRARHATVARPAPADRVRAGAAGRSADPDPRRGDLVGRHRHRAPDRDWRCGGSSPAGPRS